MGSSLGIPQGDVHKILNLSQTTDFFSHRIEGAVSLKYLPLNIGPDSDPVCPTSSFSTNIVIESIWMGTIWRSRRIRRGGAKLVCQALCWLTILASSLHRNTSLNPPAQIWGSMKFGVRSLELCCLLRCIWCYPVFSVWTSACSPRTMECMRVWYLATHHVNYTRGVFALADDNDSIVLLTKPQIPMNLKSELAGLAL